MSAPTVNLQSSTAALKFEAKLHRLWVAHQSVVERPADRRRVSPLPKLSKRDTVTAGTRIKVSDPEIGAYLARINAR